VSPHAASIDPGVPRKKRTLSNIYAGAGEKFLRMRNEKPAVGVITSGD
jgi:hypothetical protein